MKYDVINDITDNLNETYIPKTELEKMIYKFKKTKWNWYSLSVNEKITIEFVVNNRHLLWRWNAISKDKYIPEYIFKKYPNFELHWRSFSTNPSFKMKYVYDNPDRNWDWFTISKHPDLDMGFVINNPNKTWLFYHIYNRIDINLNYFIQKYPEFNWEWDYLTNNKSITLDTIMATKNKSWKWYILTNIYHNRFDLIIKYPDLNWNWYYLSTSKYLTLDIIEKLINKPWNYKEISYISPNLLTKEFILKYPYNNYKLDNMCSTFTIEDVKDFINTSLELNWTKISSSPNITMKDIIENKDFPWNFMGVSDNPNLTCDIINEFNKESWITDYISSNDFEGLIEFSSENMDMAEKCLNKYKEELMIKTWHPSRIMDWCVSIDELIDF
jgi:hypothetical protein